MSEKFNHHELLFDMKVPNKQNSCSKLYLKQRLYKFFHCYFVLNDVKFTRMYFAGENAILKPKFCLIRFIEVYNLILIYYSRKRS